MKTLVTDSMGACFNYLKDKGDNTIQVSFGTSVHPGCSGWVDADDLDQLAKKFRKMARKLREKELL